ncbi:MAG: hypothetical protein CMJ85_13690 [Planctomycetes bacterium]|nr:hypothetical protein [Planctomycetota bacterium]
MRIVQLQGLDLRLLRFDFDLTMAGVFLNADGTVYSRYGARDSQDAMKLNSTKGLAAAMRNVLELHAAYPKNRASLVGKQSPKPRFPRPELFPVPVMRRAKGPVTQKNCVHCHMVHQAEQELVMQEGSYDPAKFKRYPPPVSIGLTMDRDDGTRVLDVQGDTIAQRAGVARGDVIRELAGQPIASIADLVWVLHSAPDKGKLEGNLDRNGETKVFTLTLPAGWRPFNLGWRGSMYAMPPQPGIWVEELKGWDRARLLLKKDRLALKVRGVFRQAGRRAGIRKGDVIIAVDEEVERRSAGEFHALLRTRHWKKGAKARLRVLRDKKAIELVMRF